MCCDRKASSPRVRHRVLFRYAPSRALAASCSRADRPWRAILARRRKCKRGSMVAGAPGAAIATGHHNTTMFAMWSGMGVCDPGEAAHRLCVVDEQRLATRIGGSHDSARSCSTSSNAVRPDGLRCHGRQIMNRRRAASDRPASSGATPQFVVTGAHREPDRSLGTAMSTSSTTTSRPVSRRGAIGDHHHQGVLVSAISARGRLRFGIAHRRLFRWSRRCRSPPVSEAAAARLQSRIARLPPHPYRLVSAGWNHTRGQAFGSA